MFTGRWTGRASRGKVGSYRYRIRFPSCQRRLASMRTRLPGGETAWIPAFAGVTERNDHGERRGQGSEANRGRGDRVGGPEVHRSEGQMAASLDGRSNSR